MNARERKKFKKMARKKFITYRTYFKLILEAPQSGLVVENAPETPMNPRQSLFGPETRLESQFVDEDVRVAQEEAREVTIAIRGRPRVGLRTRPLRMSRKVAQEPGHVLRLDDLVDEAQRRTRRNGRKRRPRAKRQKRQNQLVHS